MSIIIDTISNAGDFDLCTSAFQAALEQNSTFQQNKAQCARNALGSVGLICGVYSMLLPDLPVECPSIYTFSACAVPLVANGQALTFTIVDGECSTENTDMITLIHESCLKTCQPQ